MKFKKGDVTYDGKNLLFQPGIYQELKKTFGEKDIESEVKKTERWLLYNPPQKELYQIPV